MKLKYRFMTTTVGDECVAVAVGENSQEFNGMIKLNKEGADIISLLSDEIELDELVNSLIDKYQDTSREEIVDLVKDFINQLEAANLLV